MRAYLFGNGASVACGQHTGGDFLTWGLEQARRALEGNATAQNIRLRIREELEHLFGKLHEIRGKITGDPQGLYWPKNLDTYILYVRNQLNSNEAQMARNELEKILARENFSALVEEIFQKAYDKNIYVFHSLWQKKAALIGPHSGNLIDEIEDLQRDITGLASRQVAQPNLYHAFCKLLLNEREDCAVFNLNWDNLFEQAYRDVTKQEPLHIYLQSGLLVHNSLPEGKLLLSKPHGSLEYLSCQSDAHSNSSGCFRLTVAPGTWYYPTGSNPLPVCQHPTCSHKAGRLRPFLQPYSRTIRSRRASPFVSASTEALKPALFDVDEIVVIGYSFSMDKLGWIDEDLLPIFLGKKLHIISQNFSSAENIGKNIQNLGFFKAAALPHNGFDGYLNDCNKAGHLLP